MSFRILSLASRKVFRRVIFKMCWWVKINQKKEKCFQTFAAMCILARQVSQLLVIPACLIFFVFNDEVRCLCFLFFKYLIIHLFFTPEEFFIYKFSLIVYMSLLYYLISFEDNLSREYVLLPSPWSQYSCLVFVASGSQNSKVLQPHWL